MTTVGISTSHRSILFREKAHPESAGTRGSCRRARESFPWKIHAEDTFERKSVGADAGTYIFRINDSDVCAVSGTIPACRPANKGWKRIDGCAEENFPTVRLSITPIRYSSHEIGDSRRDSFDRTEISIRRQWLIIYGTYIYDCLRKVTLFRQSCGFNLNILSHTHTVLYIIIYLVIMYRYLSISLNSFPMIASVSI